jgi:dolichol-phosphate hexosyltransferase
MNHDTAADPARFPVQHPIGFAAPARTDDQPRLDQDESPLLNRPLKLSILMPVYNEERTLRKAIDAVIAQAYPVEIELCVVDDGSTDSTVAILDEIRDHRVLVHRHPRNLGKGAAVRTAAIMASGTHMVPFDADLEYSAEDLPRMLAPIMAGRCEVVFGTRMFGMNTRYQSYQQAVGNRALTLSANLMFNAYLRDIHTCLKMMPLSLFRGLDLRETRFGLDAEVSARILQLGIRPFEVPVSYYSRSFADGKKITWRDGVHCLSVLARVRLGLVPGPAASVAPADPVLESPPAVRDRRELPDEDYNTTSVVAQAP